MRTCLFLSSAIALVAVASAATTVSSYSYPNDENAVSGFFTLINRETLVDGTRHCTILERGETQAFRTLYPVNRRGEMAQVINRVTHDEGHHHGSSFSNQENSNHDSVKELLELNTNVQKNLADIELAFLESECDSHVTDSAEQEELDDDFSSLGQTSGQLVFKKKTTQSPAQDEVRKLVDSGPDKNRVTIVFMGDGYTLDEREKFFGDMKRLVNGKSQLCLAGYRSRLQKTRIRRSKLIL
ncbi:hypothetical protein BGX26_006075 [Mortierella sp. AD094]|nr:hypothetical protein BGX26_006075 [Mortierella sp. AD094]